MFAWLSHNIATIAVCLILAAIAALIIVKMVRDRKNGKSSCGCDCGSCRGCGMAAGPKKKD